MRFFKSVMLLILLFPAASSGQEAGLERSRKIYASGDVEEAIKIVDSYISDHPDDFLGYQYKGIYVRNLAWNANDRILYDKAVALFEESLKRTEDKEQKAINWGNIGSTYFQMKQYSKAEPYYELCLKQSGRAYYSVCLAQCQVKRGRIKAGLKTAASLTLEKVRQGDGPTNEGLTAYNMGLLYAYANRPKEAVYWLRLSVEQNKERFMHLIEEDSDLDPIRETRVFRDFHQQINRNQSVEFGTSEIGYSQSPLSTPERGVEIKRFHREGCKDLLFPCVPCGEGMQKVGLGFVVNPR